MQHRWFLVCALTLVVAGCGDDGPGGVAGAGGMGGSAGAGGARFQVEELGRCADFDPMRQLYWGDTHIHTVLSLDANTQATRTTMTDAYAFAQGSAIPVQPYNPDGTGSRSLQIDRPLDFVMISDHAEFFGTIAVCTDPNPPDCTNAPDDATGYCSLECGTFRDFPTTAFVTLNALTATPQQTGRFPALCGADGVDCDPAAANTWLSVQDEAEAAYDRTSACTFTSLLGYEWSAGPDTRNLHRNVMFRNGIVPDIVPSYFDQPYVEGLWGELRSGCKDAGTGCDVLTIAHNPNLSNGLYFENTTEDGSRFDAAYVAERNTMEPQMEIYQHKGASECLPNGNTPEEECGFEVLPFVTLSGANLGFFAAPNPADYVRDAMTTGMQHERDLGTNPFKYGLSAASDTHISAPGAVQETVFLGHGGAGQPNRDLPPPQGLPDVLSFSPGGLSGVWAQENSREGIFLGMRDKETFGTSGPRISVRFFGGWDYPLDLCDDANLVEQGYQGGVPMGGDLPARPSGNTGGPKFAVMAMQDLMDGAPLQQVQLIKRAVGEGGTRESVVTIAGDAGNGAGVDTQTCTPTGGGGFASLCTVWEDPDFDPDEHAFYYIRVLENPTCRWSTLQCVQGGYDCDRATPTELDEACCNPQTGLNTEICDSVDCGNPDNLTGREAGCCLPRVETVIQERAWTSPIWFAPAP